MGFGDYRIRIGNDSIFRMDYFQSGIAIPHFPKTTERCTRPKRIVLPGSKMEKPQVDKSSAIANPADQAFAASGQYIYEFNLAADERRHSRCKPCNSVNTGFVFVTDGQVKEQILDNSDAKLFEVSRRSATYSSEGRDGLP